VEKNMEKEGREWKRIWDIQHLPHINYVNTKQKGNYRSMERRRLLINSKNS